MINAKLKSRQEGRPRRVAKVIAPRDYERMRNIQDMKDRGMDVDPSLTECRVDVHEFPDGSTGWTLHEAREMPGGETETRTTAGTDNCNNMSKGWQKRHHMR